MQSEGDEGGICVVAESCHQTSEGIGLRASIQRVQKVKDFIWLLSISSLAAGTISTLFIGYSMDILIFNPLTTPGSLTGNGVTSYESHKPFGRCW